MSLFVAQFKLENPHKQTRAMMKKSHTRLDFAQPVTQNIANGSNLLLPHANKARELYQAIMIL